MMSTSVHRLLDQAFAGLPATPDVQDLKEEIRANLLDRVEELAASGVTPDEAARRAVDELGDVRALVSDGDGPTTDGGSAGGPPTSRAAQQLRDPVSRRYVVGIVLAAVVILVVLAGFGGSVALLSVPSADPYVRWTLPLGLGGLLLIGPAVGWIVATSLMRDTTTRYGMPRGRASAHGAVWMLLVTALVVGAMGYALFMTPVYGFLMAPVLVVGTVWLAYLLATQTNRRKPWVLAQERAHAQAGNRFEEDPAAAARFGIYTIVLWAVTGAAFLAVGFAVSWLWALLPALLGGAAFMLMLARMLFGAKRQDN